MGNIIRPKETWKLEKPDPHLAAYVFEKQTNPDANLYVRAFREDDVDAINSLVELAHGERDLVKTESDWVVMEGLLTFWAKRFPGEYKEFKDTVVGLRQTRNEGGMSSTNEIKYVGALPSPRFMKMVKAIFPMQQWDKTFTNKFVKRFPLFKVGDRIDPKYR